MLVCLPHERGPRLLGPLPAGVEIVVSEHPAADAPEVEFWVPRFSLPPASGAVPDLAKLKVIQLLTAGVDRWREQVPASVCLCNARGVHDAATAEWAVTAILAHLRHFPAFARAQAEGRWAYHMTDELFGKRVMIIGAGSIGAALAARLEPFGVTIVRVARTARDGVHGVAELPALLPDADVVVLLVPLTEQTRGLVGPEFLAAMPDGALLVNAARGPVVQTDALVAELASGRIGAALDVADPEPLPPDHPLWTMPNVLITPHVGGSTSGFLPRAYGLVGDQIRRYVAGQPLINVVTGDY